MDTYGLLGFPLTHSFSQSYFEKKFQKERTEACFLNFELDTIAKLDTIFQHYPNLKGVSVTIPYKEQIIPYLTELDNTAQEIQAVNCVKVVWNNEKFRTIGYNTDCYGFGKSLDEFGFSTTKALVLGTGGASKAVAHALKKRGIPYSLVSRSPERGQYSYADLGEAVFAAHRVVINTTPLGTFPNVTAAPVIPYEFLTAKHFLFDLVYNPEQTAFLSKGKEQGAKVCNGYAMLCYQAERSWELWNS